jgi:hypothetical protein
MSVCSGVASGDGEPSSFVESTGTTTALDVDVMTETADEIDVCRALASEVTSVD